MYSIVFVTILLLLLSPQLALLSFVDIAVIDVMIVLIGFQLQLYVNLFWLKAISIKAKAVYMLSAIKKYISGFLPNKNNSK